jgi:hypothetical protein
MIVERAERWTANCDPGTAGKRDEDVWFGADELGGSMPPKPKSKINGTHCATRKRKEREHGEPLRIHYFNTFFYAKLTGSGYEKARLNKWTKKVCQQCPLSKELSNPPLYRSMFLPKTLFLFL